jgi:hypothetical protein
MAAPMATKKKATKTKAAPTAHDVADVVQMLKKRASKKTKDGMAPAFRPTRRSVFRLGC